MEFTIGKKISVAVWDEKIQAGGWSQSRFIRYAGPVDTLVPFDERSTSASARSALATEGRRAQPGGCVYSRPLST